MGHAERKYINMYAGIRREDDGVTKVITYGTYDLFHEGHYRLLQRAKQLGDYLIVGITTEEYDRTRGKLNVIDSLMTRNTIWKEESSMWWIL